MSETSTPDAPAPASPATEAGQRVEIQLDRSKQETAYVNAFHTGMNTDELLLELGLNVGQVPGTTDKAVRVELSHRLVLAYPTAKRLAGTLAQAIAQYEQRFGEIKPPQQTPPAQNG